MRRVLNGASNFHGTSLNKSLLVGPDLFQNLKYVLLHFFQHKYAVFALIEALFLQVGVLARDQTSIRFVRWMYLAHGICLCVPILRCKKQQLIKCPLVLRQHQSWMKNLHEREISNNSNKAETNKSKENTNTSTHAADGDVNGIESSKGLLPIANLGVSSDVTSRLTLVHCDSASTNTWVSSSLVNRIGLVGEPVNLSISSFKANTVIESQRVKFTVLSEPNNSEFVFPLVHILKTIF